MPFFLQAVAVGRGSPVLPDDGIVERLTGISVPEYGRFPLVGDPYGSNLTGFQVLFAKCLGNDGDLRSPYFHRVMFHPAWLGKFLFKILLGNGFDLSFFIKNNGS